MQVYPVIMKMEQNGFPVDMSKVDEVKAELDRQIADVESQCFWLAGDEFSLSDLDAKRWVLFGEARKNPEGMLIPEYGRSKRKLKSQNLRVWSRTKKTHEPSLTAAVLDFYAERGNRMAELLSQWSGLEKLRGTFVGHPYNPDAKKEEDRPATGLYRFAVTNRDGTRTVHTGYKQHGTVTGRLSSTTPNLQQLPREMEGRASIRDLFVAAPGKLLIVADYDQVELRCAGYLSKDANMIEVFREGQDIHRQAAAAMFRLDPRDVTGDQRQVGKTQNFAVLYGAGPDKIAAVAGCSVERAEELIAGYFQAFPSLERWKAKEIQNARKRGDRQNYLRPPHVVIPPNMRQRRLPDLFIMDHETDDEGKSLKWKRYRAERQAINAIVQGFASNITKLAMLKLDAELPETTPMLAQVHDEIVFQVDEQWADEQMEVISRVMGEITNPTTGKPILGEIPLVASAATGTSWANAKKKAA
jgi:DNA polymerase-1